jgi:hypothetical protein
MADKMVNQTSEDLSTTFSPSALVNSNPPPLAETEVASTAPVVTNGSDHFLTNLFRQSTNLHQKYVQYHSQPLGYSQLG